MSESSLQGHWWETDKNHQLEPRVCGVGGRRWQELQTGQLMKGLERHVKVFEFHPLDQWKDSEQGRDLL